MHVGEGFSNELFLDPEGLPVCSVRLYSLFDRLCIPLQGGRPLENGPWAHDLGAQFIVTRERIRANPRMLYEGWYHIFTTHSGFSDEFAWILERCWHTVFGEVAVHIPQKDWFSFEWFVKNGRGGDAPMWDWPQ
jgi:hypothetical protein